MKGYLRSRLNHPVTIKYGEEKTIVPPNGQTLEVEIDDVKYLPKGVMFIPIVNSKKIGG
jgi:hypothetical protein